MKKLRLNVDTVRNLAESDLKQVGGGYDSYFACPQTEYPRPSVCQTNCRASDCICPF
ncbi:MAG TPA: hypothetical protein VFD36_07570 [Kofleriaceae bacterium]|nr:hypothetical protein [Kofleriaceae bacterium]